MTQKQNGRVIEHDGSAITIESAGPEQDGASVVDLTSAERDGLGMHRRHAVYKIYTFVVCNAIFIAQKCVVIAVCADSLSLRWGNQPMQRVWQLFPLRGMIARVIIVLLQVLGSRVKPVRQCHSWSLKRHQLDTPIVRH